MTEKLIRTIKAISVKKKTEGNIGFLTEEEDKWFNVTADEKVLDDLLSTIIQKGNVIEFEVINGFAGEFKLNEKAPEKAQTKSNFSDDLTSFEDLLNDAHNKFENFSIHTQLIENDWENKRAIFKALIYIKEKETEKRYEAYGDATQDNIGQMIKIHYIRMAETRAIVRALRWATNNAKTATEETSTGRVSEDFKKEVNKSLEREKHIK